MATTTEALGVQPVVYPEEVESSQNFGQPIQMRWPEVNPGPFILCVGTSDGNWDILSGLVGQRKQQLFDFSDLSDAVETVFVQLIFGDAGNVGPVIKIHRK